MLVKIILALLGVAILALGVMLGSVPIPVEK